MAITTIDLNADLGEGAPAHVDRRLLGLVSSANIATGGHAGDEASMLSACEAALELGAAIGAHPSYEDRVGFGRAELGIPLNGIRDLTLRQLIGFAEAAERAGGTPAHVKPHGALYHRLAVDRDAADVFAAAVAEVLPGTTVIGPPRSAMSNAASANGLHWLAEGFADRAYQPSGLLVPRTEPGSSLGPNDAAAQALRLVGLAERAEGIPSGQIGTICIHGDGLLAVEIANAVMDALSNAGVAIGRIELPGGAV